MSVRLATALALTAHISRSRDIIARIEHALTKARELDAKARKARHFNATYRRLATVWRDTAAYWERQL